MNYTDSKNSQARNKTFSAPSTLTGCLNFVNFPDMKKTVAVSEEIQKLFVLLVQRNLLFFNFLSRHQVRKKNSC